MIVLGIDPGLAETGWSVLESQKTLTLIDYGCLKTKKETDFSERLVELADQVSLLVEKYKPDVLAIEELFFAKNVKTAIKVAECLGVIKYTVKKSGFPVYEYTPLNIKMTIAGYGRADKEQVELMVSRILKLKTKVKPDHAADAVAVALTHLYTNLKLKS